jgi:hypothetical protein
MAILSHFSSLMIVATFLWSNIFFQDLAFQVTILFWFTLYQIDIFFLSLLLSRFSSFLLGRTLFFFFVWLVSFASPYLVQELINFHQDSIVFFFCLSLDAGSQFSYWTLSSCTFISFYYSLGVIWSFTSWDFFLSLSHVPARRRWQFLFCLFAWLIVGVAT